MVNRGFESEMTALKPPEPIFPRNGSLMEKVDRFAAEIRQFHEEALRVSRWQRNRQMTADFA